MSNVSFAGFVGPAYRAASWKASAQRCVNLYMESDPEKGSVLYGTPGHTSINTIGNGPVLAMEATPSGLVVVSNSSIQFATGYDGSTLTGVSNLGDVSSGYAVVAQAGDQVMIVNGNGGYSFNRTTPALTPIVNAALPANLVSCCALDGYFIVHGADDDRFFWSAPFNPQSWDALDFASAENVNDKLQRAITVERELYLIGSLSTEIWATSSGDETFSRIQGTYIPYGTPAPLSAATIGRQLLWLAQDQNGGAIVMQARGLQASRVSTHAIEAEIASYASISDAYGITYQQNGHLFYCLTFPNANRTWVYDISTQQWHERMSLVVDPSAPDQSAPISRVPGAWRARCHAYFSGVNLIGDRQDPIVSKLSPNIYSDNGVDIIRTRTTPHIFNKDDEVSIGRLEVVFQPGVGDGTGSGPSDDPKAMLRVSKDGGQTFGPQRTVSIGRQGEYLTRALWNRLGRARDIVCEVSISARVQVAISGASMDMEK